MADPRVAVFGGEYGFDTRAGTWHAPAVISPEVRAAANIAVAERSAIIEAKVTGRQAVEWVLSLAMLTAGRAMSTDDAKARATAYASMLAIDYPAAVLTRESLQRAAKEFKFFPSYAELSERLDAEAWRLKNEMRKLRALAAPVAPTRTETAVRAAVRPMPGAVKADAVKAEPKPEKASAVAQPPSAEQIAAWAAGCGLDEGAETIAA